MAAGRPFEIVPILCPDVCGPTGTQPPGADGPDLRQFATAVGELITALGTRTVIIAGADLSHVGQRFNDPEPTTPAFLEEVARSDRALLTMLEAREEEQFVAQLGANGNPTRVCSAGCIFTLLTALPGRPCRILSYHQAVDMRAETHVTCAAAVVC
jgi:MEMO1 family protein